MARIRTIKPEFWTDSFMVQLPPLARLIYISLWTSADDHGFIPDEPERLAMEVMPREDPQAFDDWMQFYEASGRLEKHYSPDGESCYRLVKWEKHQRVDKPSKSKLFKEGSRKLAIPLSTRRDVATKYGCAPGGTTDAACYYCGNAGAICWHTLQNGRPSSWVTFPGLELDHLHPESLGGGNASENIVLACRSCNRSKGMTNWIEHLCKVNGQELPKPFATPREDSHLERKGKEQGKEQGTGSEEDGADAPAPKLDKPVNPAQGTRLPVDWAPSPELITWTKADFPAVDPAAELLKFRDYWIAKPGAAGRKADWPATWRNWIRRAGESKPARAGRRHNEFENRDYTAGVTSDGAF